MPGVAPYHILIHFPPDMRYDVQEIFKMTPHQKQVMMFSATLSKEVRPVCKKFMHNVSSCVGNDSALAFSLHTWLKHGLTLSCRGCSHACDGVLSGVGAGNK